MLSQNYLRWSAGPVKLKEFSTAKITKQVAISIGPSVVPKRFDHVIILPASPVRANRPKGTYARYCRTGRCS